MTMNAKRWGYSMKMYELVSAFNEFCAQSKMPEYTIYYNDVDGLQALIDDRMPNYDTACILQEVHNSAHYDCTDNLVQCDPENGFRSLDYKDIRDLLKIDDFRKWLGGSNHA